MRLLVGVWLLLAASLARADALAGVVIVVIDGDTVLFKPEPYSAASRAFLKVRLADIDAPEKDQPYGDAATRALSALVLNRRVELDPVATDIYGRTIARIQVGALPVGAELVRQGFAWASSRNAEDAMRTLQDDVRRAGSGLWQDADPIPPWVWRRTHASAPEGALSR